MLRLFFILLLAGSTSLMAMGEKVDKKEKDKIIIESDCLCDPEEETQMPRFY